MLPKERQIASYLFSAKVNYLAHVGVGKLQRMGLIALPLLSLVLSRANSRSLSVIRVTLGSHELECPDLVAADPFRGFLDGVHVFHAE